MSTMTDDTLQFIFNRRSIRVYTPGDISDPKHPEREELLNWLGEPFDPEAFDLAAVNFLLSRVKL